MKPISRRAALSLIGAAAAATPLVTVAAPEAAAKAIAPAGKAWIVGTPGLYDWQHIIAESEGLATSLWVEGNTGIGHCEALDEFSGDECDCEYCYTRRGVETERIPAWDGRDEITSGEWIDAGLGSICARCGYEAHREECAHNVGGLAVCEECMTLADWEIVDPERAAELRDNAD